MSRFKGNVGATNAMMDWLPAPRDFRGCLRLALQPSADRLEKLAALAQHRLSFLEMIQLDRALGSACPEPPRILSVRLAILASTTVDHLVPAIRVSGLRRQLLIDVHIGPYGQYRQQLLDAESPLHLLRPQIVLLSLTARDAIASVPVTATARKRMWRSASRSVSCVCSGKKRDRHSTRP